MLGIKNIVSLVVIVTIIIFGYFYFSSQTSGIEKECRDKAKWSIDTMNAARKSSGLQPYGKEDQEDIYKQCIEKKS